MPHPDMSPALRDHMQAMHFIGHQTLGVAKLTDAQRERLAGSYRAARTGISEQWKPTPGDTECPF